MATKTYEIRFTGRKLGAIGKFYKIEAQVFAPDDKPETLIAALGERYEINHIDGVKETQSPFDADGLVERVQNTQLEFNSVRGLVTALRHEMDAIAARQTRDNQNWHDDPEAADWALYHAAAGQQFTRAIRDAAILELVSRHLDVLNENEAALDAKMNAVNA